MHETVGQTDMNPPQNIQGGFVILLLLMNFISTRDVEIIVIMSKPVLADYYVIVTL